jgi:hypothetical protein
MTKLAAALDAKLRAVMAQHNEEYVLYEEALAVRTFGYPPGPRPGTNA